VAWLALRFVLNLGRDMVAALVMIFGSYGSLNYICVFWDYWITGREEEGGKGNCGLECRQQKSGNFTKPH
jgi:hypothetical protein